MVWFLSNALGARASGRAASSVVVRRFAAVGIGLGIFAPLLLLAALMGAVDADGVFRRSVGALLAVIAGAALANRAAMLWRDAGYQWHHRVAGEPAGAARLRSELAAALRHAQYGARAGLISIVCVPDAAAATEPGGDESIQNLVRSNVRHGDCVACWAPSQIVVLQKLVRSHGECEALAARLTDVLAQHSGHAGTSERVRVVISLVGMIEHMRDVETCVQAIASARGAAFGRLASPAAADMRDLTGDADTGVPSFRPLYHVQEARIVAYEACLDQADRNLQAFAARACRDARHLPAHVQVAVRLSAHHLAAPGTRARIEAALRDSGLAADRLELSVDHAAFDDLAPGEKAAFAALRARGVRLCLENVVLSDAALNTLDVVDAVSVSLDAGETRPPSGSSRARATLAVAQSFGVSVVVRSTEPSTWLRTARDTGVGSARADEVLVLEPRPALAINHFELEAQCRARFEQARARSR